MPSVIISTKVMLTCIRSQDTLPTYLKGLTPRHSASRTRMEGRTAAKPAVFVIVLKLLSLPSAVSAHHWAYPTDPEWSHPELCHLKLVCAISSTRDADLLEERFVLGIRRIAEEGRHASSALLAEAIHLGEH